MADAFDAAWDIIKMGKEEDDEERRMLQHIASMVMGMNYDDGGGGGYLEGLMQSGQNLDNFLRERFKETGGPSGGYMRGMDENDMIEELMGQMSQADYDRFELQSDSEEDMNRRIMEEMGGDFVPRPDNMYEAPSMVRGDMAKLMALIQSNPEMYHNRGYDGTMAGHFGGYSMKRPDMKGMYDSEYEEAEFVGDDFTGDYFGDDGNIKGTLSKIKLLDALKRMGLM